MATTEQDHDSHTCGFVDWQMLQISWNPGKLSIAVTMVSMQFEPFWGGLWNVHLKDMKVTQERLAALLYLLTEYLLTKWKNCWLHNTIKILMKDHKKKLCCQERTWSFSGSWKHLSCRKAITAPTYLSRMTTSRCQTIDALLNSEP